MQERTLLVINLIVMGLFSIMFFNILNNWIIAIVAGFLFFFLYFLPTYTALHYEKRNLSAIFALNLFLGWTFVGWVIALVWALTHEGKNKE